ncbi:hypothetical protein JTE90_019075 [Oedothorax gibbosus]|uniref:TTF-type domain-containing protein n=1 Tax=Oedothorax gibbosus TaxID=931172 RepID=A0AAV6TWH5_9ARAC|nr:hypothetical protein JTE90_019075 [Oedothorax gibbosus]
MKRIKQTSLLNFIPAKRINEVASAAMQSPVQASSSTGPGDNLRSDHSETSEIIGNQTKSNMLDIGHYVKDVGSIDRTVIYKLLKQPHIPDTSYVFPKEGKRNLRFQRKWLEDYKWLAYSVQLQAALCKYCVLFSSATCGKGGHQKLSSLANSGFKRWKDVHEIFQAHSNADYHKTCVTKAENFVSAFERKTESVEMLLNSSAQKKAEENRKRLIPIVETIIFLWTTGIGSKGNK